MPVKAPPASAFASGYYNVIRPDLAPNWQLRAEFTLLFTEG
jgi:hypothetical protein